MTEVSGPLRVWTMLKLAVMLVLIWVLVGLLISGTETVSWWAFFFAVIFPGLLIGGIAVLRPEHT